MLTPMRTSRRVRVVQPGDVVVFQSSLPLRLFAPAVLLALMATAAPAEDLAMPSGEAWWHRLAQCGGLTLYGDFKTNWAS